MFLLIYFLFNILNDNKINAFFMIYLNKIVKIYNLLHMLQIHLLYCIF